MSETELTGKEGNKLVERASGEVTDPADYRNTYGRRTEVWSLVVKILREIGAPTIVEQTGFSRSAVYSVLGGATPRHDHSRRYVDVTVSHATTQLAAWDAAAPASVAALLQCYIAAQSTRTSEARLCRWCGEPIPPGRRRDAKYDSDKCRQAAARSRQPA